MSNPVENVFRMPSEWQPHAGTWVSWPHNVETWPNNLAAAQAEFFELVLTIAHHEHVYVGCDEAGSDAFCRLLTADKGRTHGNIILDPVPTNDAWIRDYGPTFVFVENIQARIDQLYRDSESSADQTLQQFTHDSPYSPQTNVRPWFRNTRGLAAIDWKYNAWGGKYPPFDLDQSVSRAIADHAITDLVDSTFIVEGGALEINDAGVLITTESCLLDPNRNPQPDAKVLLEAEFKRLLGVNQIIWLPGDCDDAKTIIGDDTDGHIDQIARFIDDTTLVYAWTDDEADPQHAGLADNVDVLKRELADRNLDYSLIAIPLPAEPIAFQSRRIPASYCNFYITNGRVIVPQFGDVNDQRAVDILREHFPKREVIGLPSNNLSVGLGSFHCLTQQMPATGIL